MFEYNAPLLQWGCLLCNHPERATTFLTEEEPVIEGQLKAGFAVDCLKASVTDRALIRNEDLVRVANPVFFRGGREGNSP